MGTSLLGIGIIEVNATDKKTGWKKNGRVPALFKMRSTVSDGTRRKHSMLVGS